MKLIDGKAAKIFERLWQWRGQWIPAKWLNGWPVKSCCLSTYVYDAKEYVRATAHYALWEVQSRRDPDDLKHWQYRIGRRNAPIKNNFVVRNLRMGCKPQKAGAK